VLSTPCPDQPRYRLMEQAYKTVPLASELRELFDYKPLTGELIRKKTGKPVGSRNKGGYWTVRIQNKIYYSHRIIWCWVTGLDPASFQIDHKNINRSDNRWTNLRLATKAQNMRNRRCRGITRTQWGWRAQIMVNRKGIYLGCYSSEIEATAAYKTAAIRLHGEFWCVE
jgi:hypothetical protein